MNGQLAKQFNIETNHAHTFWGLCTHLQLKPLAFANQHKSPTTDYYRFANRDGDF
jgi:hypothetical protein